MSHCCRFIACWLFALALVSHSIGSAQDPATEPAAETDVAAGHSYHGEAFNEGPRQKAFLMPGLGRSQFKVTTTNPEAQKFFNQGVDQLHGFWYFEAERSFRQVVFLDPDCVMGYWGLCMANINNDKRAEDFIAQAKEKMSAEDANVDDREKMWIDSLAAMYDETTKDKKKRIEAHTKLLEEIVLEYPDDIEAKAFLACRIWMNQRNQLPITSYVSVNALLDDVFAVDPQHPAHHYRIHLWDNRKPEAALQSAAACGPSLPDIAHMWHMPGHIYSRLKRYQDAVWQQEASARVDHRNMMHDQVMPDQIHNFAHNNEWCIRNLNHVGRVRDAVDLATNMVSLPRHPKYNHFDNRGSTYYGRVRLLETLTRFELWEELIEVCNSQLIEPTDQPLKQLDRLRHLGRGYFRSGNVELGSQILEQLNQERENLKTELESEKSSAIQSVQQATKRQRDLLNLLATALPKPIARDVKRRGNSTIRQEHSRQLKEKTAAVTKDLENRINAYNRAIDELTGYVRFAEQDYDEALKLLRKAGGVDALFRAQVRHLAGDTEDAIKEARAFVEKHENEVQPLANLAWLLWQADQQQEARESFEQLRKISASIDMQSPVFTRLQPIADACGIEGDWRVESEPAEDLGTRPALDALGPFCWQPIKAPQWKLQDLRGTTFSSSQFDNRPVIVIFYLGHGCLHCAEQIQAFAPQHKKFQQAGIEMLAISTDEREGLQQSIDDYGLEPLPIQLLANPELNVFKAFRAYDEFEDQPLHGTYLIGTDGRILWQDIGYEPFMEVDFLFKESQRLLRQQETFSQPRP